MNKMLTNGRWYWWGNELLRITNPKTGRYESLDGVTGCAILSDFREVTVEDLDHYEDQVLALSVSPGEPGQRYARIARELSRVRVDNGLPLYSDRRLVRALELLGAEHQPPPNWQRQVMAQIQPGILRRFWRWMFP